MIPNAGPVELQEKATGRIIGHLDTPQLVNTLSVGDVVWDFDNDCPATFQGWSSASNCYVFTWHDGCGDFCGWDTGGDKRPVYWRKVVMH